MTLIMVVAALVCMFVVTAIATVRLRAKHDLEANSIEPDELHTFAQKKRSIAI